MVAWYNEDVLLNHIFLCNYEISLISNHCFPCSISQYFYVISESTFGTIVGAPGFHEAGQTSPCSSVYLNAFTSLITSSMFLPTGRSFIDMCLIIPLPS